MKAPETVAAKCPACGQSLELPIRIEYALDALSSTHTVTVYAQLDDEHSDAVIAAHLDSAHREFSDAMG